MVTTETPALRAIGGSSKERKFKRRDRLETEDEAQMSRPARPLNRRAPGFRCIGFLSRSAPAIRHSKSQFADGTTIFAFIDEKQDQIFQPGGFANPELVRSAGRARHKLRIKA